MTTVPKAGNGLLEARPTGERVRAAVTLTDFSVAFFGVKVLHEVNAVFPETGITVILGRSGSGKTTLLRGVNRLNEEFPGCETQGQVTLDLEQGPLPVYDRGEGALSVTELRRRAGMLFQTPSLFPVSAYRNLTMPLQLVAGVRRRDIPGMVEASLRDVGLWEELKDRLDIPADRLSGGQQQRLCLARTLALRPSVLLLDEPTASLDVHAARGVEELLRELSSRYAVILVSHSLSQAGRLADRILICDNGRVGIAHETVAALSEESLADLL